MLRASNMHVVSFKRAFISRVIRESISHCVGPSVSWLVPRLLFWHVLGHFWNFCNFGMVRYFKSTCYLTVPNNSEPFHGVSQLQRPKKTKHSQKEAILAIFGVFVDQKFYYEAKSFTACVI